MIVAAKDSFSLLTAVFCTVLCERALCPARDVLSFASPKESTKEKGSLWQNAPLAKGLARRCYSSALLCGMELILFPIVYQMI